MRFSIGASILLGLCLVVRAEADDQPLTEDLLTLSKHWSVGANLVYANSESRNSEAVDFVQVQTGPAQFVRVPSAVGEQHTVTDLIIYGASASYGLTENTEFSVRASASSSYFRSESAAGTIASNDSRFSDAWLGLSHRFDTGRESASLFGFAQTAFAENSNVSGTNIVSGKSWLMGVTSYRKVDPMLFSITAAYQYSMDRNTDRGVLDPGDVIAIDPSVSFLANPDVTLSLGTSWSSRQGDTRDGGPQSIRITQMSLNVGVGYAWSENTLLFFNTNADISGAGGASVSLSFLYQPRHEADR